MTAAVEPTEATDRSDAHTRGAVSARWRVAARLAARQVRRTRASSALIVALIMLPIAMMTAYGVITASTMATPQERATKELGRSEAWLAVAGLPDSGFWQAPTQPDWHGYPVEMTSAPNGSPISDPTSLLPSGTTTVAVTDGTVTVATPDGRATLQATAGAVWDPSLAGRFDLVDGRAPTGDDEALVTPAALDRLGIRIGDDIELVDSGRALTVTGTMTSAPLASSVSAVFLPSASDIRGEDERWYVTDRALSWDDVTALNEHGVIALSRSVLLDPPDATDADIWQVNDDAAAARWSLLFILSITGLFAAYVVIMLAGAAFAVVARRQQRSLAVAASVGATARDLRRVILLQGAVLGLTGGATGLALGVGGAAVVMSLVSDGSATRFPGFHVFGDFLVGILLFAVVVGTASAAMPARTVARSDVLGALRGARRPQMPKASKPIWGTVILAVGLALTLGCSATVVAVAGSEIPWDSPLRIVPPYGIVLGPILVQLGILLSGRWLLWMTSRALSHVSLAARLGSRDAAANSSRTVPAFAAIAATVFIGVFALGTSAMQNAENAREWFYQAPVGALAVTFPPAGTGMVTALDAEQRAQAADAARELAHASGAATVATVARQPEVWDYPSPEAIPDDVTRAIAILPDDHLLSPESSFRSRGKDPSNPLSVVAAGDLETVLGVSVTAEQRRAYRDGAAIVADPRFITDGTIDVAAWTGEQAYAGEMPGNIWPDDPDDPRWQAPLWKRTVDAIALPSPFQPVSIAIAPETAERLGIHTEPAMVVAGFDSPVGDDVRDRIQLQAQTLSTGAWALAPAWEDGPPTDTSWMAPIIVAVAVLVLGASAVALGLARLERRPDDATLSAVGGTDRTRRAIGLWQGLIIAGFGTVAGAAAGVLPPIGLAIQSGGSLRLDDIPWALLAGLAIALPLAIALVSWLVPPGRPDLTRRTAIA